MVLQRWYPIAEVRRTENRMNRFWRSFGYADHFNGRQRDWDVPLDVEDGAEQIVIRASLPGVTPEETQVTIDDGVLTIRADANAEREAHDGTYLVRERRTGSFSRSIRLPDVVDADKAESTYQNGVLTISLPKDEAKKPKQIEVKVSS